MSRCFTPSLGFFNGLQCLFVGIPKPIYFTVAPRHPSQARYDREIIGFRRHVAPSSPLRSFESRLTDPVSSSIEDFSLTDGIEEEEMDGALSVTAGLLDDLTYDGEAPDADCMSPSAR